MIHVTSSVMIDESLITCRFTRSGGPGGQNVNKVETAVELYYDLKSDRALPGPVRDRLIRLAGKRINSEGILIVTASESRYQEQNREIALEKLLSLVRQASVRPKHRKKTRPSAASREKRLTGKKKEGRKKAGRKRDFRDD